MKILLWNINGIRAIIKKKVKDELTFEEYLTSTNSDIICFNETKISSNLIHTINILELYPYVYHSHSEIKKGYSGVSIYSKIKPNKQTSIHNDEGRLIVLEFDKFILVNVYQPNAGSKLARLNYRTDIWDNYFINLIKKLQKKNNVIIVGDMNVAHTEMDIKNPDKHLHSAGFTIEERNNFNTLLDSNNLIDAWRHNHPHTIAYTYFDYRSRARERNSGWRLDYLLTSEKILKKIKKIYIDNIFGSDHLPLITDIDI
jgi:exodeoxyribonuclease-3